MITIDIPSYKTLNLEHLVLDFNGTLAIDGNLIPEAYNLIKTLSSQLRIHCLTSDTFGTSKTELQNLPVLHRILADGNHMLLKNQYVQSLGADNVVAIGNGSNDFLMLKSAALGIALIQKEGASTETLKSAHIICHSVIDALELLIYPNRLIATLRK
jgi:soluble P-type ATPase